MNKTKFAFAGIFAALLLGALLIANHKRQQTPTYILGQYSRSANFDLITEHHLRHAPDMVFTADWFDTDNTADSKGCRIDQAGARTCEIIAANRSQAMSASSIPIPRLIRFQKALSQLPAGETVAPPLKRLFVVSFRDGPGWTTRIYDRAKLPAQLFRLSEFQFFKTIPERPEFIQN